MNSGLNPCWTSICNFFAAFGIIKPAKSWLGMRLTALYFYIINNGSTVRREENEQLPRSKKLHHELDLSFFSYGKQSLEVDCFYRGPFFFYSPSCCHHKSF